MELRTQPPERLNRLLRARDDDRVKSKKKPGKRGRERPEKDASIHKGIVESAPHDKRILDGAQTFRPRSPELEPPRLTVYKDYEARCRRPVILGLPGCAEQAKVFPQTVCKLLSLKRKWWNWQTHHLEGVAPKGVGVQIPSSAPSH